MKACLYLVPTPIGNLSDITLRALETLKRVDLIAAEDTRTTSKLLGHFQIAGKKLISYHKFNEQKRVAEIIAALDSGSEVAIVSDAGSPGISDPSQIMVRAAIQAGYQVCALPGATAFVPALTASGLDSASFCFYGFLPAKAKDRWSILNKIKLSASTSILYESTHHIRQTLEELLSVCGDRDVVLARELSKIYEEYVRGSLSEILADWQVKEKGEFVLLVAGAKPEPQLDEADLDDLIRELKAQGKSNSEIVDKLTEAYPRNLVYRKVLAVKGK
ncbi:MAG TPA: 16S rRNA (cytidine(1402)-2'-O)-methyltransferase [Candidatus Cloacimonadota bacterium]|nr:16S rRNA (cytidine(1402)-2'-O)-methyltransferase [Candidatus Cloacimonadota bacterium]